MKIEDYSYLQEGGEEEGEGEEQGGGGIGTMLGLQKKNADSREKALQQVEEQGLARVRNAGPVRRAAVATIVNAREFGKNAKEKAKSGVSGATSFAQGTAALAASATAKAASATAKAASVAASAPSQLASSAAALYSPPKSVTDLINERKFMAIPFNESARDFETEFKSELSDLVVKFFTVSDYTPSFEFSKIKVLKKLSSIKLYHTKLCLKEIFAELKICNAYLFQSPLPDQPTPEAAIKQFKGKIQRVVEANFKDDFFNNNIAIYISNTRHLSIEENLDNYLFKNSPDDYSITNLHEKSIFLYILQLFVIYYYPKYLLEIICKVMVENVTAISEGINALMNDGNLNIKLSELIASLVSESKKTDALRIGGQSGGEGDPRFAEPVLNAILDLADTRKDEQLSREQIKKLVFDKYIKGVNLQDQYNKKSRKVFYNALVNFAISIRLDITRNNYTSEIITKLEEFSDSSLILSEKAMNDDIVLIQKDIDNLNTNISAQVQLIEGPPGTRLTRDALFDKYYAATTQDNEKKNIRRKILNTTSVAYPIYVEFQKLERFRGELEIMEKKKSTYKRINEVKRKMFEYNNILEIKDDIWLGRGIGTIGDNYHDALYNLIMTAAEQSLMFSLNGPEVRLVPLDPLYRPAPQPNRDPDVLPNGAVREVSPDSAAFSGPTLSINDLNDFDIERLNKAHALYNKTVNEAYFNHLNANIKELEAEIRELEEELKKAPTDPSIKPADVQLKLLTAKDDLDKANQKLAAAIAAADADANANTDPVLSPPAAAPVPPLAGPPLAGPADAAGTNLLDAAGALWQNIVGKSDPKVEAAKAEAARKQKAEAEAAEAAAAEEARKQKAIADRIARARLAAAKREAEKKAKAEIDAANDGAGSGFGGKRRTRRHKKRAGTRRYKKRAGTRRHKKRSGTHKKRKNRTR